MVQSGELERIERTRLIRTESVVRRFGVAPLDGETDARIRTSQQRIKPRGAPRPISCGSHRGRRKMRPMAAIVVYRAERRTWEVRCWHGGRRTRRSFGDGGEGQRCAQEFAAAVEEESRHSERWLIADGGPIPTEAALRGWLSTYRPTLSRSFEGTASGLIENHLVPFFGARNLRHLGEADSLAFADWMSSRNKGHAVVRNALGIMRLVASLLVEKGLLKRNPFANVGRIAAKIKRRNATEVRTVDSWTREEVSTLLRLARGRWIYRPLLMLLYTGARRGEMIGLRWEDVDFSRGVVRIRRARVRGEEVVPKSGRAREVPLDVAGPELRAEFEQMAKTRPAREGLHTDPGLVFRSPMGRPIQERNLSRAWESLRRLAAKHGVRPLRLHDARHTFASHAIENGVSPSRVAAWLGHASAETTHRIYSHVVPPEREIKGFLSDVPRACSRNFGPRTVRESPEPERRFGAQDEIQGRADYPDPARG
jgi:integrase